MYGMRPASAASEALEAVVLLKVFMVKSFKTLNLIFLEVNLAELLSPTEKQKKAEEEFCYYAFDRRPSVSKSIQQQ